MFQVFFIFILYSQNVFRSINTPSYTMLSFMLTNLSYMIHYYSVGQDKQNNL